MGRCNLGITFDGDVKSWPKKNSSICQGLVDEYAMHILDEKNIDLQWAVIRGDVHGGKQSSQDTNHLAVRFTDITGSRYDAHIGTNGVQVDFSTSTLWGPMG